MNKVVGIILLIVIILGGAAIVTHQLHVWPWSAAGVIETAAEPAVEPVEPAPSVEEIPVPEEVAPAVPSDIGPDAVYGIVG